MSSGIATKPSTPAPPPSPSSNFLSSARKGLGQSGIFIAFFAILALFAILTKGTILTPQNISNLVVQNSYILILAIGMVIVIIAGHIDLSVGSVVGFTGALAGVFIVQMGLPVWLGVLLVLRHRRGGRCLAGLLGRLLRYSGLHRHPGRNADLPRRNPAGAGQQADLAVPGRLPQHLRRLRRRARRVYRCPRIPRRRRGRPVHPAAGRGHALPC